MVYTYEITKKNSSDFKQEFFKMVNDTDDFQTKLLPIVLQNHFESSNSMSDDEWYDELLSDKNTKLYLIKEEEVIVGYIHLLFNKLSKLLTVISLYIKPEFRGKGFAKQILLDLIKEVKHSSSIKGLLLSVFENNKNARKLYQKLGFTDWTHSMYLVP